MTDRQSRRIERLLRFQCFQNHNILVSVRVLVAHSVGAPPDAVRAELEDQKAFLAETLGALVKDERAEHAKQAQTREQQEAMEAELQRLDDELANRPPVGFK